MNSLIERFKKLKAGTVVRTVLQFLVYINQAIAIFGTTFVQWASNPVYQWISFIVTVLVTLITYWYNNDWSSAAQTCGELFDMIKDGKITKEETEKFLEKHKNNPTQDKKE